MGNDNQMSKNLTTISSIPEPLKKDLTDYFRCNLLHDKIPVWDSEKCKIYHLCPICKVKK
jgi:hypothetical protein